MMDSREGKDTTRSFRVYKDGGRVEMQEVEENEELEVRLWLGAGGVK